MRAGGASESQIFPYLGPLKYAMNVMVIGEETSRIYLAPTRVGEDIINGFDSFDPLKSTAYTVTRSKVAGKTQHTVVADAEPVPILTGDNSAERIARILRAAANLNDRFRLPTLQEQKEAWANR
jgi:hypothetical protein